MPCHNAKHVFTIGLCILSLCRVVKLQILISYLFGPCMETSTFSVLLSNYNLGLGLFLGTGFIFNIKPGMVVIG